MAKDEASAATIALDTANPLNDKIPTSLRLTVTRATKNHSAGVANSGYRGTPVHPKTQYHASQLARKETSFAGPLTVSVVNDDDHTVYDSGKITGLTAEWKKFEVTLKTGNVTSTAQARFAITLNQPGTVRLGLVSLFPPTWNDCHNSLRKDIM